MIWMTWALGSEWSVPRGFPIAFGASDVVDVRVSSSRRRFILTTEEAGGLQHRDHRGRSVDAPATVPPPLPDLCGGPCTLKEFVTVGDSHVAIVTNQAGAARRVLETVDGRWTPVGTPRAGARSLHRIDGGLAVVFHALDAPLRVGVRRDGEWDLLEGYDVPRDPDTSYGPWALAQSGGAWHLARIASKVDAGDQLERIDWTGRWERSVLPISEPVSRAVDMVSTKHALWLAWSDDAGLQIARDSGGSSTRQTIEGPSIERFSLFTWKRRVCAVLATPTDAPRARLMCRRP